MANARISRRVDELLATGKLLSPGLEPVITGTDG